MDYGYSRKSESKSPLRSDISSDNLPSERVSSLQKQLDALNTELAHSNSVRKRLEKENTHLLQELEDKKKLIYHKDSVIQMISAKLSDKSIKINLDYEENYIKQIKELEVEGEQKDKKIFEQEKKIQKITEKIGKLEKLNELLQQKADVSETHYDRIKQDNSRLIFECNKLDFEFKKYRDQKTLEIAKLNRKIDELEDHHHKTTTRIQLIESDINRRENQREDEFSTHNHSHQREVSELNETIEDLRRKAENDQEQIDELKKENVRLKRKIEETNIYEKEAEAEESVRGMKNFKTKNEELEDLLEQARLKIKTLEHEIDLSNKRVAFLEEEIVNLKEINQFTERTYQGMQTTQRKMLEENSIVQEKYVQALTEIDRLRKQLALD